MRVRPFRIPKQVILPGLLVQIRTWPRETPELEGEDGAWLYDTEGRAVVYVAQDLPIEEQRYTLLHELVHVMIDYLHVALKCHPQLFMVGR